MCAFGEVTEYLSLYFKKLKSYPDTTGNIHNRTGQDEIPRALSVETEWMLLVPSVFAWFFLAFLLDSFPLHHSQIPNLSVGEATVLLQVLDRCIYMHGHFLFFN